jgi:hypothetical protein
MSCYFRCVRCENATSGNRGMGTLREAKVMVSVQGLAAQSSENQDMETTTCCICTDYVCGLTNDPENCQSWDDQIEAKFHNTATKYPQLQATIHGGDILRSTVEIDFLLYHQVSFIVA